MTQARSVSERGALPASGLVVCVASLALVVFAFDPAAQGLERHHLTKELVLSVGAALGLLLVAMRFTRAQPEPLRLDRLDGACLGVIAIEALASWGAIDADLAARQLGVSAAAVAMFLVVRSLDAAGRARLDAALLSLSVALATWMIFEAYALVPRVSLATYAPGVAVGQRNNAAHLLAMALSFATARGLTVSSRRSALVWLAAIAPMTAALVLTRSRAGWLAAALGMSVGMSVGCAVALGAMRLRARHMSTTSASASTTTPRTAPFALAPRMVVWALVLGMGLLLPLSVRSSLPWRSERPYADTASRLFDASEGSGQGRLTQWQSSLALLREHPWLGVGPGHWAVHYPHVAAPNDPTVYRDSWAPTSRLCTSDVVAWCIERGVLGAAALLLAAALLVNALARRASTASVEGKGDPDDARTRLAPLAALFVVASLDCSLQIALGAVALAWVAPTRSAPLDAPSRLPLGVSRAVIVALAVALLALTPRAFVRARHAHLRPTADGAGLAQLAQDPFDVVSLTQHAEQLLATEGCEAARPTLTRLATLRPHLPRLIEARVACGQTAP